MAGDRQASGESQTYQDPSYSFGVQDEVSPLPFQKKIRYLHPITSTYFPYNHLTSPHLTSHTFIHSSRLPFHSLIFVCRWSEISDRDDILYLTSRTQNPFQAPLSYATAKPIVSQRMPHPNSNSNSNSNCISSISTSFSTSISSNDSGSSSDSSPNGHSFYPSVLYLLTSSLFIF